MGPVAKKGAQIREEMIKESEMKDQKRSCNKGEAGKESLRVDMRGEGQGGGGITSPKR